MQFERFGNQYVLRLDPGEEVMGVLLGFVEREEIQGGFFLGLGSAMLIAMYDYVGYYDVCYIGDEVRDPSRTIPRSIRAP